MEQFRNVNSLREEDRASLEEFNHSPYPRTYHYQSPSLKEAMMKWEYKIVGDFGNYTEMLNGYGVEGWELVSVLPNQGHETGFYVFIFKRPIIDFGGLTVSEEALERAMAKEISFYDRLTSNV